MKNSISLYVIAIILAISTNVHAQHRALATPFIDTIQQGNTAVIQSVTYSQSVPLPYEKADPKEVYRAAKSGEKLTVIDEDILFNFHSIRTITEYVYENNSWKSSIINIDLGVRKETFYLFGMLFIFYIMSFFLFKIKLIPKGVSIGFALVLCLISLIICFSIVGHFWETKLYLLYNALHLVVVFILWLLLPFITKIKIRKNNNENVYEPSHQ